MNTTVTNNVTNNVNLSPFKNILDYLQDKGWQLIDKPHIPNKLVMNKKYYELQEILIEYKNDYYHFSLPINNSIYSYYKKFHDSDTDIAIDFLTNYVDIID
jgi:hypothetical protein